MPILSIVIFAALGQRELAELAPRLLVAEAELPEEIVGKFVAAHAGHVAPQRLAQLGSAQADSLPVTGITLPQMLAYARRLDRLLPRNLRRQRTFSPRLAVNVLITSVSLFFVIHKFTLDDS
mgnify:CR=1 FL=1